MWPWPAGWTRLQRTELCKKSLHTFQQDRQCTVNRFSKNTQISNFMKIRPVGAEFHAYGRTDMTKLVVTFRDFTNAPKNVLFAIFCVCVCVCVYVNVNMWQMKISSWFENLLKTVMVRRAISSILLFRVEECFTADGGSTFFPSIGRTIQDYTVSCTSRRYATDRLYSMWPVQGMLRRVVAWISSDICNVHKHSSFFSTTSIRNRGFRHFASVRFNVPRLMILDLWLKFQIFYDLCYNSVFCEDSWTSWLVPFILPIGQKLNWIRKKKKKKKNKHSTQNFIYTLSIIS